MPEAKIQKAVIDLNKRLDKKIEATREALQETIAELEAEIIARVLRDIPDPTVAKAGDMPKALKTAMSARDQLVKIFSGYYKTAAKITDGYEDLIPPVFSTFAAAGVDASFTNRDKAVVRYLQQVSFDEYKHLGDSFIQTLSKSLFSGILGLKTPPEIAKTLRGQLTGLKDRAGKPMSSHAKQLAHDSIMNFSRAVQTEKSKDLGIQYFQYVGTTILDSRPFCVAKAGKIFTSEQVDSWDSQTWAGKNPNLPVRVACGGYNCRHHLQPLPDAVAKMIAQDNGQTLPSPPIRPIGNTPESSGQKAKPKEVKSDSDWKKAIPPALEKELSRAGILDKIKDEKHWNAVKKELEDIFLPDSPLAKKIEEKTVKSADEVLKAGRNTATRAVKENYRRIADKRAFENETLKKYMADFVIKRGAIAEKRAAAGLSDDDFDKLVKSFKEGTVVEKARAVDELRKRLSNYVEEKAKQNRSENSKKATDNLNKQKEAKGMHFSLGWEKFVDAIKSDLLQGLDRIKLVKLKDGSRAYARYEEMALAPITSYKTVFHEFLHNLEMKNTPIKAVANYIRMKTGIDSNLDKIFKFQKGWKDAELAPGGQDKRVFFHSYASKYYGMQLETEVISMLSDLVIDESSAGSVLDFESSKIGNGSTKELINALFYLMEDGL